MTYYLFNIDGDTIVFADPGKAADFSKRTGIAPEKIVG
jgi:hypothetical protein